MSHSSERKEKICLNCNTHLSGSYCHNCGQKNLEPKESVWGLVTHFFNGLTHFDGQLFSTLKYLIIKPGFLSKEHLGGRRARYLHPIHMYLFTSACFFIVFFSAFHVKSTGDTGKHLDTQTNADSLYGNWKNARAFALKNANSEQDSIEIEKALKTIGQTAFGAMVDSLDKTSIRSPFISFMSTNFHSKADYYLSQQLLPVDKRAGWITKRVTYKQIEISENIAKDPDGFFNYGLNKIFHMFPQLLVVSLPLFALLLGLLYWRNNLYFSEHVIFSIHLYIFAFVSLMVYLGFSKLQEMSHWGWIRYILASIILYIFIYTFEAMRRFYQQGFFKTFIKYCMLHLLSITVVAILFMVFFTLSIFQF